MNNQLFKALLDRLSAYIDGIQADSINYETVVQSYGKIAGSSLARISNVTFPSESEQPDKTGGYHIKSFRGTLQVPTIKKTHEKNFITKIKKPKSLLGTLFLPSIPLFKLPFIPPIFDPDFDLRRHPFRFPLPRTVPVPSPKTVFESPRESPPVTVPPRIPGTDRVREREPTGKPTGPLLWQPKLWATYSLQALLQHEQHKKVIIQRIEEVNPWLVAAVTAGGVAIRVAAPAIFRALQKTNIPKVKAIGYLGLLGLSVVSAPAEEKEQKAKILLKYGEHLADLEEIQKAIKLKKLTGGEISPYSIESDHVSKNKEWYDNSDWFHEFPGDWPTMRDIYFTAKAVAYTDAPGDMQQFGHLKESTMFYIMQPTYLYDDLINTANNTANFEEGTDASRKLKLIITASKKFGKEAADKIPKHRHGVKREPDLDRALWSGGFARFHGMTFYTEDQDYKLTIPELSRKSLKKQIDDKGVTLTQGLGTTTPHTQRTHLQNLSRTSRIKVDNIDEEGIEKINKLLENYILNRKTTAAAKRDLEIKLREIMNKK